MAPDFRHGLSLQMSQRMDMVMTPQMIQSMEMLQLPLMALEQKINQELQENPALELLEMRDPSGDQESSENEDSYQDDSSVDDYDSEDLRRVDEIDMDWDSWFDETAPHRRGFDDEERFDIIENAAAPALSFTEYLVGQLKFYELTDRERYFCERIIYNLDNSGYLTTPLRETLDGEEEPLPTDEELASALSTVQQLDPPGVGATNTKMCLLLQIDALSENHHLEHEIVEHHLEDLAANRLPLIAKSMSCSIDDVKNAAAFIRTLNPHPGLEYGPGGISHVQPDVIVDLDENGDWEVRLVGGVQPDISDMFLALFDTTKRGKQLRDKIMADPDSKSEFEEMQNLLKNSEHGKMMREKYQSAKWLVGAVAQRERTLLRVAKDIVDNQKAFLSGQTDAPAPLMMQDVADRVGIDISTVSRAVRDKYIDTPLGIKPLRMFFTRAVGGEAAGGKQNSNVAIMNRIKEIIDGEDKSKPLKDDEILTMLAKEGIDIKRRTVAKYRSNLGFPNHSQRREY